MIKMRNVGAQTQKKWRPGGPPLKGRGTEGWSPEEWGPEGSGAQRGGAQTYKKLGPKGWGPKGGGPKCRAPQRGGSKGWGPEGGEPKISRFFLPEGGPQRPPWFHTTAREPKRAH